MAQSSAMEHWASIFTHLLADDCCWQHHGLRYSNNITSLLVHRYAHSHGHKISLSHAESRVFVIPKSSENWLTKNQHTVLKVSTGKDKNTSSLGRIPETFNHSHEDTHNRNPKPTFHSVPIAKKSTCSFLSHQSSSSSSQQS